MLADKKFIAVTQNFSQAANVMDYFSTDVFALLGEILGGVRMMSQEAVIGAEFFDAFLSRAISPNGYAFTV